VWGNVYTDDGSVCRRVGVWQEEGDRCSLRDVHDRQPILRGYQRKIYVIVNESKMVLQGKRIGSLSSAEDASEKLNFIPA